MSGAKSSVSGIGVGVKFLCVCVSMVDFKWCMLNSCVIVVVLWVVVSPYFGEAKATRLWGGLEDGARRVIIQTEIVGSFRTLATRGICAQIPCCVVWDSDLILLQWCSSIFGKYRTCRFSRWGPLPPEDVFHLAWTVP